MVVLSSFPEFFSAPVGRGFDSSQGSVLKCVGGWDVSLFSSIPPNSHERLIMTSSHHGITYLSQLEGTGLFIHKGQEQPPRNHLCLLGQWQWVTVTRESGGQAVADVGLWNGWPCHWSPASQGAQELNRSSWTLARAHFVVQVHLRNQNFIPAALAFPFTFFFFFFLTTSRAFPAAEKYETLPISITTWNKNVDNFQCICNIFTFWNLSPLAYEKQLSLEASV